MSTDRTVTYPADAMQRVADRLCDADWNLLQDAALVIARDIVLDVGDVLAFTTEGRIGSGGINQPVYFDSVAQYVARNLRRALAR